jgi:hypothetical protein
MTFKISNNIAPCNIINRLLLVTEVKNWLVLGSLKDDFSTAQGTKEQCGTTVNNKMEITWKKEAVTVCFQSVSQQPPANTVQI